MTHIPPAPLPDESLLLSLLMGGPATLNDTQLVATLLHTPDLARAKALLHAVGNLYHLVHAAPLELSSFGLAEDEIVRILAHTEVTSRVVAQRRKGHLGTLDETVQEIRLRGEQWSGECVGMLAMDPHNRVQVDRVLYQGTLAHCDADISEILRVALRAGAHGIVVYRWSPLPEVVVLPADREFADRLRLAASALEIHVLDTLLIAEGSFISLRYQDEWAPR